MSSPNVVRGEISSARFRIPCLLFGLESLALFFPSTLSFWAAAQRSLPASVTTEGCDVFCKRVSSRV